MLVVEINIFLPKLQHLNFEIEQINKWKNNFLLCICLRIKLSRNNRSFSSVLRGCKRRCFLWRVPFKIAKGNSCGILVSTRNTILVSSRSQTVLHIGHPDTEPRAPPVTKEFAAILYNCGHSFLSLFLFFHLSHYEFEKKRTIFNDWNKFPLGNHTNSRVISGRCFIVWNVYEHCRRVTMTIVTFISRLVTLIRCQRHGTIVLIRMGPFKVIAGWSTPNILLRWPFFLWKKKRWNFSRYHDCDAVKIFIRDT